MGHYWRDLDPSGAEDRDRYFERLHLLRQRIRHISLGQFTVEELGLVMKLMGLFQGSVDSGKLSDSDFEILEAKTTKE